jgi:hypothetical protein
MSYYPICFGALSKVYDDILDMSISHDPIIIHLLQSFIIVFLTLTSYHDFYFSFSFLFISMFCVGIDHPFWKSFLPVMIILFIASLPYREDVSWTNIGIAIGATITFLISAYMEDVYFPEEYSWKKLFARGLIASCCLVATYFVDIFIPPCGVESTKKVYYIVFGYFLTSVIIQFYYLLTDAGATRSEGAVKGRDTRFDLDKADAAGLEERATEDAASSEGAKETSSGITAPVALNQA